MRLLKPSVIGASAAILLTAGIQQAFAVDFEIIDLNPRANTAVIAILGSKSFDPRDPHLESLAFGPRNQGLFPARTIPGYPGQSVASNWWGFLTGAHRAYPAEVLPFSRVAAPSPEPQTFSYPDVNGDGFPDRVIAFPLSDVAFAKLYDGGAAQGELRGIYKDGLLAREFRAYGTVAEDTDPASSCTGVDNQQGVLSGERCIWQTANGGAYKPIDLASLVDELNQALANASLEIAGDSAVVLEAYGGQGHHGHQDAGAFCTASGGDSGPAGYARTIWKLSDLEGNSFGSSGLFVYPSVPTSSTSEGGASTVVSFVNLADLNNQSELDITTPSGAGDAGILAIAGGGGGGGPGALADDKDECNGGGNGGAGGIAIADTSDNAVGTGGTGGSGDPGHGGAGTGGSGYPAGTDGIGGPGGIAYDDATQSEGNGDGPLWSGWSTADNLIYTSSAYQVGAGGYNQNKSGSGGGGFGGGGAAKGHGDNHKGGGGGGGSFAVKSTIEDTAQGVDALILGSPGQYQSEVAVTFQVTPVGNN